MLTFMLTTSAWAMIILARSRNTNPGKTKWCGITTWYERCTKSYLGKNGACPLSTEVLISRTLKMRGTNSHCFWLQGGQDTTQAQGTCAEVSIKKADQLTSSRSSRLSTDTWLCSMIIRPWWLHSFRCAALSPSSGASYQMLWHLNRILSLKSIRMSMLSPLDDILADCFKNTRFL